ncbi:Aromatic-L-amino-acid decarboxylase [Aphelenchoides avenae]|nr:Aromatic-L-amino-acid decarboxylase [Aphelenchus avenae]
MSPSEFRRRGRQMVDYIADYIENIHNRRVVPSIEPGYLQELIPPNAPMKPESYEKVMHDFESYIMPGVTHWQHPRFHAYFPAGNSFPSILADMLSDALGCMGFSWAACPAMTELEMIVLQWFGQMIGLPKEFLPFTDNANGGGVIQGSASECNFVALLAARFEIMRELRQRFPFVEEGLLMSKLIAYCSKEAHSSVEKAAMIGMVKLRILETDSLFRLRGDTLQAAITEDRQLGLIPFFVSTTLGTTSVCSFDVLSEIGPVCSANDLWLHVDAAYAGAAFVCPEFRYLMSGIEHAMSFNTNPNKWMLVNFDCSAMWVKDRFKLTQALVVDPLYLQHSWMDKAIDYRHWGIPLSRRFRSLKLWFVIRMYGIEGIQKYIREHVRLAKKFEALLRADDHFEIIGEAIVGLVCFRLKASDETNQNLLTKLNSSGRIHMVPASLNERFVIRFCVCAEHASDRDILVAYDIIKQASLTLLYEPMPEPIAENYELEQLEEKQYEQMNNAASMDSQSIHSSQRSLNNRNSIESTGSQQLTVAPGVVSATNSTTTPPSSAGVVLPTQTMSEDFPFSNDRRRFQSTLKEKRSFLVRMVSDPKCYNPKIVRHLNMRSHKQMSQEMFRDRALREAIEHGSQQTRSSRYGNGFSSKYSQFSVDNASDDDEYVSTIAPDPTGLQTPM